MLKARVIGVEVKQDEQRHQKGDRRGKERQPFGIARRRFVVATQENHEDQCRNRRQERDNGKQVGVHYFAPPDIVIHVTRTAIPITMAKA